MCPPAPCGPHPPANPRLKTGVSATHSPLQAPAGHIIPLLVCKIATLAISAYAELYSLSNILRHRNLVSTQIYANVNLEKKIETVNLTNGMFG